MRIETDPELQPPSADPPTHRSTDSIEEDFITWKELLWTNVCEKFNILVSGEEVSLRQYELQTFAKDELGAEQLFKGEIVRLNSYMQQKT